MDAGRFTIILYLLSTMLLINSAMSYDKQQNVSQINNVKDVTTEWMNKAFVATTPRAIKTRDDSRSSSEEEDDDDEVEHPIAQVRQASNSNSGFNPVTMVFNAVTSALLKSAQNVARKSPAEIFRSSSSEDDDEYYEDGSNGTQEAEPEKKGSSESSVITRNTTSDGVFEGRQAGGSYIKGDPLNGYYDFVITEGSYKFWVVFQLFTAGLLIYSTLAAIYYSKVNPLTSDYDYVDYLSRSFHGRSMDSADVDDDADDTSTASSGIRESARTYLSSLEHNKWVRTAAYGFQFAMDAIDRIPK
ncbi:unnamed protein product [Chironomus riparius]|uniref:Uncharacterized protein n=1 Tax=Chironomus riparius TaxID=315576 RepID=A0A9N9WQJ0_9DIPT|nr:unnamed protein product [Chironomus riparius]